MAVVTEVKKVRKHMEAVIDGETYVVSMACFRMRPLDVGEELDLDAYRAFLVSEQFKPAMGSAVKLLAARGYATKELQKALTRGGYLPETACQVTDKLTEMGFLNDLQYTSNYIQSHLQTGHGRQRLEHDLRMKGIDRETFDQAFEAVQEADPEAMSHRAEQLATAGLQRAKPGESQQKARQRVVSLLMRRGFSFDEAKQAVQTAWETLHEDEDETEEPEEEEQIAQAAQLVQNMLGRVREDDARKVSQKLLSMLARRGYPYNIARSAISKVMNEMTDDEAYD